MNEIPISRIYYIKEDKIDISFTETSKIEFKYEESWGRLFWSPKHYLIDDKEQSFVLAQPGTDKNNYYTLYKEEDD